MAAYLTNIIFVFVPLQVLIAILYLGNIEFIPLEDEMSKLVADQGKFDTIFTSVK